MLDFMKRLCSPLFWKIFFTSNFKSDISTAAKLRISSFHLKGKQLVSHRHYISYHKRSKQHTPNLKFNYTIAAAIRP